MSHKNKSIEVVVGVMRNDNNEIFITRRQIDQFMSGYWELPGGKVENKESHSIAIMRELYEETGVTVKNHHLIQTIEHQYPQKTINLSVFSIEKYDGAPLGNEGQEFCWCDIDKLKDYKLLPTMWKIIHRICLPKSYWITPDEHESDLVINQCKQRLRDGIKIIQLRSKSTLNNTY
ncbi:MAG: 8-oxo-dGTP diphosphatase MutT, partial [Candidatus Thioglobus sp.]|nr:8-oxo-dGTP diphosphatase MutT [Candidatus Thioglobus sp.]